MHIFILKRLLMMLPVLFGVVVIIFTLMYVTPGCPAFMILGGMASEADVAELRYLMGLDDPYFMQFGRYVANLLRGDLGTSFTTRTPVFREIMLRFPQTMMLAVVSMMIAIMIGIPTGIVSATKQYSIFDNIAVVVGLIGVSMPNFWQALLLILLFSVHLNWFPPSGFYGPEFWVLPALTLGTSAAAVIMRMTRSSMLEVIRQDYIRTARAKGQRESVIIMRHALKNALIPVITVIGLQFGTLLGGAVLIESIFSIAGVGRLMVDAITARDNPIVQGGVLFIAFSFSFINLIVDVIYAFVDPRMKSQFK